MCERRLTLPTHSKAVCPAVSIDPVAHSDILCGKKKKKKKDVLPAAHHYIWAISLPGQDVAGAGGGAFSDSYTPSNWKGGSLLYENVTIDLGVPGGSETLHMVWPLGEQETECWRQAASARRERNISR